MFSSILPMTRSVSTSNTATPGDRPVSAAIAENESRKRRTGARIKRLDAVEKHSAMAVIQPNCRAGRKLVRAPSLLRPGRPFHAREFLGQLLGIGRVDL